MAAAVDSEVMGGGGAVGEGDAAGDGIRRGAGAVVGSENIVGSVVGIPVGPATSGKVGFAVSSPPQALVSSIMIMNCMIRECSLIDLS